MDGLVLLFIAVGLIVMVFFISKIFTSVEVEVEEVAQAILVPAFPAVAGMRVPVATTVATAVETAVETAAVVVEVVEVVEATNQEVISGLSFPVWKGGETQPLKA